MKPIGIPVSAYLEIHQCKIFQYIFLGKYPMKLWCLSSCARFNSQLGYNLITPVFLYLRIWTLRGELPWKEFIIQTCLFVCLFTQKRPAWRPFFVYMCVCISIFVYLYAGRRAPVKGVDYTKAGGERGSRALWLRIGLAEDRTHQDGRLFTF